MPSPSLSFSGESKPRGQLLGNRRRFSWSGRSKREREVESAAGGRSEGIRWLMSWKKPCSWEAETREEWRVGTMLEREIIGGVMVEVAEVSGEERRIGRERESAGGRRWRRQERASAVASELRLDWVDGVGGGAGVVPWEIGRWWWGF